MRHLLSFLSLLLLTVRPAAAAIDRQAVLDRNNPHITAFDSLAALTVGNGGFAFTVDATGLQTFPEHYSHGIPLGTQSDWGWHAFPNTKEYKAEEALKAYDFGHGSAEALYSCQFKEPGRQHDAAEWLRINPHRLHLGSLGFCLPDEVRPSDLSLVSQQLVLATGAIESSFRLNDNDVKVTTTCDPERDLIAAHIVAHEPLPLRIRFPYPTGAHADDGCDWTADSRHRTTVIAMRPNLAVLERVIDATTYFVVLQWTGEASVERQGPNSYVLTPATGDISVCCEFLAEYRHDFKSTHYLPDFDSVAQRAADHWHAFWFDGAMVDFGDCTDKRAPELERRVVLSQYLLAVNCAGDTPPQETGLTYNSWYGKFHLEMIWWHQAQFALWGHADLLEHTLAWYEKAEPMARQIAERQGYEGVRWMKMTDPSAAEAPSNVGSFLIWQQPHLIHLAELVWRANPSDEVLHRYYRLIQETADFMCSFVARDEEHHRYVLQGVIPAQETLRAAETVNPPLELSSWRFGLVTAQQWRERMGMRRVPEWDEVIDELAPLAQNADGLYLAAESAKASYTDLRYMSDHPAVLGALGMYPASPLVDVTAMRRTLNQVWTNWNWTSCWGWDFPLTALCAARVGQPDKAVDALLMPQPKNTYLPNGHNWQSDRLRLYLPGNGGLLTAVAMMCAGWDGAPSINNPGFPQDGSWNVHWEGLKGIP